MISVLIQASHPISFGSDVKVKRRQSLRDPSVLTSICSALSQFKFSVLFNLCVIWNSQAWRTQDETECLLSCKYCKWNHDVALPSSRGVSNYGRVIRLLCQVKSSAYSCVIAAVQSAGAGVSAEALSGFICSTERPEDVEKICSSQSKQLVKSLLDVSVRCPRLSHWSSWSNSASARLFSVPLKNMVNIYCEIVLLAHLSGFTATTEREHTLTLV